MPKHKGRKREGGFKRFLRRLFSVRIGALGAAASAADPLHVESGSARPHRRK